MNFDDYQRESRKTAIYPKLGKNFVYPTLGLAGEAGEVVKKVKKIIRDKNEEINEEIRAEISREMGDVLWYLAQLASELDLSLNDVAIKNIEKISKRKTEGKINGDGDNR